MEFIDSTGHIFSLPSYEDNPINLEYVEGDYIFWLKDSSVSINNYYIKPIRFLLDEKIIKDSIYNDDNDQLQSYFSLEISNSSQFYKLISPKYLQSQLEQSDNISKPIGLDKSQFVDKLTLDDFYFDIESANLENDTNNLVVTSDKGNKFYMFPFYVVGFSEIEGSFLNNITIKYTYQKETSKVITHNYTRDEYYNLLVKKSLSPIKVYSYDMATQTKSSEPVLIIEAGFSSEKYTQGINAGFNKYEILYSGDPYVPNVRTDNILSTAYDQDSPEQVNQYKRIRNFSSVDINGNLKLFGNMFTDSYHYIYRLENELPSGYYVFEGEIYDGCNYCGSSLMTNHDGYLKLEDDEYEEVNQIDPNYYQSIYPGDDQYANEYDKYCTQGLVEINSQYTKNTVNGEEVYVWNRSDFVDVTGNVKGYIIKEIPVYLNKTRDFWLDVDNRAFAENTNGKTVVETEFEIANIYTPITVGCTFIDECEELIINGKNMGIRLPKEVLKAIYNSSFYSKNADEKLLKNKLKELLLNYMNIKGETGNFKSMINSLKWFGWNKHISISQLIKTDNDFQNQFILDYFDIYNDIKDTFKYFNRTNNISLTVLSNKETGENYQQDYTNVFIGEGKPQLEDLFSKNVEVIKDDITFYKPYYNFIFNELALKLDCLKYYYQQYFLPVHININRASIAHKVYANTTKLSTIGYSTIVDKPVYLPNHAESIKVIFPDTDRLIFMQSNHIIDDRFNEFSDYNNSNPAISNPNWPENQKLQVYYVNENCVNIPIQIEDNSYEYVENSSGIYYLHNGEYVKMEYFYTYNYGTYKLIEDLENEFENATHYSMILYSDIRPLESITRYDRISKQYSKDNYGDYYKDIDSNYVKINYFYKMISDDSGKLSNRFEATHYSIIKNENIKNLKDIQRYSKISEGYFRCKLILTATTINKNSLGHYVKIGDKYFYKEKFYKNDFTGLEDLITNNDIDDSGNYIKMYNKFIRINSDNRYDVETICLVNNDNFNFYQSVNQYYKNFILIPRLLNNELDYEKAYFRLSLLVNDKWFKYDFRIVTPNVYLDLGRLDYKYSINHSEGENEFEHHPFNQLKSLSTSNIEFNAFMFEPDLITINTLFKEVDENDNSKVLTFIDKLLQMDNGEHEPDQRKMYEFYKKYYSNVLRVPYNTKYYNRIHIFDICTPETVEHGGLHYVVKIEGFEGWTDWGDEWSPVNGGRENVIYGFQKYREHINRQYPDSYIICYRENNNASFTIYNSGNIQGNELPAYNDNIDGKITHMKVYSSNGTLIETLYSYYGKAFDDLYLTESSFNYPIDHSNRFGPWWYTMDQINTTQKMTNEKLEYDGNPKNIQLYRTLFNDGTNNITSKLKINESVDYDIYLMHDQILPNRKAYWYLVLISKYPIASYPEMDLLNIHQTTYQIGDYNVIYADYSIDKFLVNRMVIKKANGYNHFNMDDFIIVGVNNNDYQFNIDLNNKWSIQQMYDVNQVYNVNSNTNLTIIPNNNVNNLYTPGYYNVQLQYTINGLNNILHTAYAQYRVLDKYKEIEYPEIIEQILKEEEEIFSIKDTISDGTILFANSEGKRMYVKDPTKYIEGYHPIGIKIVNAGYFAPNSPAIYMGLKHLTITDPENGRKESGYASGGFTNNYPYFGMSGITLNIPTYDKICYYDEYHNRAITSLYVQTDNIESLSSTYKNEDGTPKYPAPNGRAFPYVTDEYGISTTYPNILNDNDTLRTELLDETCALTDWNGKLDNQLIKNTWYNDNGEMKNPEYADWETVPTMYNPIDKWFSPAVACALRYHTYGTNPGDWYVPSYAQVFFMIFNFKRYTEIFNALNSNYPDDCKPDLLNIGGSAFFTSSLPTVQRAYYDMWDIHVNLCYAHIYAKAATWYTIPFIDIEEDTNNSSSNSSSDSKPSYTIDNIKRNKSKFKNYTFKYEDNKNQILTNFLSMSYDEVTSFNDLNIAPKNADHIGIYNNESKIGNIRLWESISKTYDNKKYSIGLISDIHYNDYSIDTSLYTYTEDESDYYNDIENAFSFYDNNKTSENTQMLISCGDVTSNNMLNALNFKLSLNTHTTLPFYTCLGNHDVFVSGETDENGNTKITYRDLGMQLGVFNLSNIDAWNQLFTPQLLDQPIHYEDENTNYGKTSFWFEKRLDNNSLKSDIFVILSLNYGSSNNSMTTINIEHDNDYQTLVNYVGQSYQESIYDYQYFNNSTLVWLKNIFDTYPGKRIFVFTHIPLMHKVGSNNNESFYNYGISRIDGAASYCLSGLQFEFLNKLNNEYTNTIWISGHTHYKWNWQTIDKDINITNNEYDYYKPSDGILEKVYTKKSSNLLSQSAYNVHLPSLTRPLGVSNEYMIAGDDSEGAMLDIYENYVDIRGIIFKDSSIDNNYINKHYPLAQYRINIPAA